MAPALALVGALAASLQGCLQSDQELPLELDGGAGQSASIGTGGGLVSIPPSFSIQFPAGSLPATTTVTAAVRTQTFPPHAGPVVPGSGYDVGPVGLQLLSPARVLLAVPTDLLGAGEELRIAVALLTESGSVVTGVTSYDVSNGILIADVSEIGPLAAVVSHDAIPAQDLATIPPLGGGSISPPSSVSATGPVPTSHGGVQFTADCSGVERRCLTSGIAEVWVDDVVRERMGDMVVLVNTTLGASLDFLAFDPSDVPGQVVGYVEIEGELRGRLDSVVSSRSVGEELTLHTGPQGTNPTPTDVSFSGGLMTLAETAEGRTVPIAFAVTGIGTGEQITIRLEGALEFGSESPQSPANGRIAIDVRLRR